MPILFRKVLLAGLRRTNSFKYVRQNARVLQMMRTYLKDCYDTESYPQGCKGFPKPEYGRIKPGVPEILYVYPLSDKHSTCNKTESHKRRCTRPTVALRTSSIQSKDSSNEELRFIIKNVVKEQRIRDEKSNDSVSAPHVNDVND